MEFVTKKVCLFLRMDKDHYEEPPELSEWDLQSIQAEIEVAHKRKGQTLVWAWENGEIMTRGGIIEVLDLRSESIVLDNPSGPERIPVSKIIGVQCA